MVSVVVATLPSSSCTLSMSAADTPNHQTEQGDCASSSEESSNEGDIDDLCKVIIEEDGEKEIILVPSDVRV